MSNIIQFPSPTDRDDSEIKEPEKTVIGNSFIKYLESNKYYVGKPLNSRAIVDEFINKLNPKEQEQYDQLVPQAFVDAGLLTESAQVTKKLYNLMYK